MQGNKMVYKLKLFSQSSPGRTAATARMLCSQGGRQANVPCPRGGGLQLTPLLFTLLGLPPSSVWGSQGQGPADSKCSADMCWLKCDDSGDIQE